MLLCRWLRNSGTCRYLFSDGGGTDYTSWVLARSASHNHNIEHSKRKYVKDRYSIHKLTNVDFMCHIVNFDHKYELSMNEKIILLAQLNHILEVMKKNKRNFHQLQTLITRIQGDLANPNDLACLGTLMCCLVSLQSYSHSLWQYLMDALLVKKYDEDYDELFGITIALEKYRKNLFLLEDYQLISKDTIISKIPIVYRNSLQVIRQYITFNLFNIKECRLIFDAFYKANINERYFWTSVKDWFNIYIKEQLNQKQMDEFFIINEGSIEKVLHDHGIIRPRPILQELTHIGFILSEFNYISWRFIEFAQDLVLYSIDNGSSLYRRYQEMSLTQPEGKVNLNQHLQKLNFYSQKQKENVQEMEKKYKSIFINPIDLRNETLVYFLVILTRAYGKDSIFNEKLKNKKSQSQYDKRQSIYFDPRVTKWLLFSLVKPEMKYTIKQLLKIIQCEQFLKEQSQLDIMSFVREKLKDLRDFACSFKDLQALLHFISGQDFKLMIPVIKYFFVRSHPSDILKLIRLIEKNQWISRVIDIILVLPKTVNSHYKYFSFEENCYFLYLLLKNQVFLENYEGDTIDFDVEMEKLKESIKIVTYSRGFKLSINSYFHKIMEYIDVVQFFQGGTV